MKTNPQNTKTPPRELAETLAIIKGLDYEAEMLKGNMASSKKEQETSKK